MAPWKLNGPFARFFRDHDEWERKHLPELIEATIQANPWKYCLYKPDPPKPLPPRRLDLFHLEKILATDRLSMREYLDPSEVAAFFASEESNGSLRHADWKEEAVVLNQPLLLSSAIHHAIGRWGNDVYDIPAILYSTIEQLRCDGLDEPNLFLTPPDEERTNYLLRMFDQPYASEGRAFFEKAFSVCLEGEPAHNLCALVTTYLYSLPDAAIEPCFITCFWVWCVLPTVRREKQRGAAAAHLPPYSEAERFELETRQIATARALIRLLPRATIGFFVYLLSFFAQALQHPKNGLTLEHLVNLLPGPLFGYTDARCKHLVVWFVTRWGRIHKGLFDEPHPSVEDLFGNAKARRRVIRPQEREESTTDNGIAESQSENDHEPEACSEPHKTLVRPTPPIQYLIAGARPECRQSDQLNSPTSVYSR